MARILRDSGWRVSTHDAEFPQDAPDTHWLPIVSARGDLILTRDQRIRTREDELAALLAVRARVVFVGFKGGTRTFVDALLAAEPVLQRVFEELQPPYALSLSRDGGLRTLDLRRAR